MLAEELAEEGKRLMEYDKQKKSRTSGYLLDINECWFNNYMRAEFITEDGAIRIDIYPSFLGYHEEENINYDALRNAYLKFLRSADKIKKYYDEEVNRQRMRKELDDFIESFND